MKWLVLCVVFFAFSSNAFGVEVVHVNYSKYGGELPLIDNQCDFNSDSFSKEVGGVSFALQTQVNGTATGLHRILFGDMSILIEAIRSPEMSMPEITVSIKNIEGVPIARTKFHEQIDFDLFPGLTLEGFVASNRTCPEIIGFGIHEYSYSKN